jgi:hypothetical protein
MIEHPTNVLIGVLCAVVFFSSLAWQGYLWRNTWGGTLRQRRLTVNIPLVICALLPCLALVGTVSYGVLAAIDPSREVAVLPLVRFVLAVTGVCLAFLVKVSFNGVLLGSTATWTLYHLLAHGDWSFIPIFSLVFEFIASGAPDWVQSLYTVLCLGYATLTAIGISIVGTLDSTSHP